MPDRHFSVSRLAQVYDLLDPDRSDLSAYVGLLEELGIGSVMDVGCGTGTFALMLAARDIDVIGVDPAEASLEVARGKSGADRVTWVLADAAALPDVEVDAVTMTGNVAQVFLDDAGWSAALRSAYRVARPGGYLIFESRDPVAAAWRSWTPAQSYRRAELGTGGVVESWVELTSITESLVSFRTTFRFSDDGIEATSDSTLRFRTREELAASVQAAGFREPEIRDAPDRPGLELVFIAPK